MIFEVSLDDQLSYDNGNGTKTKSQVAPFARCDRQEHHHALRAR